MTLDLVRDYKDESDVVFFQFHVKCGKTYIKEFSGFGFVAISLLHDSSNMILFCLCKCGEICLHVSGRLQLEFQRETFGVTFHCLRVCMHAL